MGRKEDSEVSKRVNNRMELTRQGVFDFPSRPKNILYYLTHRFLFRESGLVKLEKWDALLKRFVDNPANGYPQTPASRTSARGNMTSQVFSEDEGMSVNTFVKSAVVAEAVEIDFIVVWKMKSGQRIIGKHRHPLTPDTLMNLKEEEAESSLIAKVTEIIQKDEGKTLEELAALIDAFKAKKKAGETS